MNKIIVTYKINFSQLIHFNQSDICCDVFCEGRYDDLLSMV